MALDARKLTAKIDLDFEDLKGDIELHAKIAAKFVGRTYQREDAIELAEILASVLGECLAEKALQGIRVKTVISE